MQKFATIFEENMHRLTKSEYLMSLNDQNGLDEPSLPKFSVCFNELTDFLKKSLMSKNKEKDSSS